MKLITTEQLAQLLANGKRSESENYDPYPVVKLFMADAPCTWLLCDLHPNDEDIAFGLCDLGIGFPELGSVCISELTAIRRKIGLPVERDRYWKARGPISAYAAAARRVGHIVDIREGAA